MPNRTKLTDDEWGAFYGLLLNPMVQRKNADVFSTSFSGFYAVAHNGGYCLLRWANGTRFLNDFQGGANGTYDEAYIRVAVNIPICNTY